MAETLSGTIERVIFHNPENGFSVLLVEGQGLARAATIVGHLPGAAAGESIEATGVWVNDRNHGRQFQADVLRSVTPQTLQGIEKYLGSGLIRGLGPGHARKIVEVFGERTLQVIDESPAFLREIKGIGKKRIQQIRDSWQEQKGISKVMVFLHSHGIGSARAVHIYKTYGQQAVDKIRENPYRLADDIRGIGFVVADQIAQSLGVPRDSPIRVRAALRYVLQQRSEDGHVGFPEAQVIAQTAELTSTDTALITAAIEKERLGGKVVRDQCTLHIAEGAEREPWLYLTRLHTAETGVAEALLMLGEGQHPLHVKNLEGALGWAEKKIGLQLAPTQREAVRQAATRKVLVITGGPGVGKTTIIRAILEIFASKELRCLLCAPTGRAAKRLGETTGREARTIHRLLEFEPTEGFFQRNENDPLKGDLVVVDEASMVDMALMYQLLRAVPPAACLVLVGDVDQLPSVGPGTVLQDIIRSQTVPVVRLTEIFRQAEQSWIVRAAHRVNHGEMPEAAPAGQGDFYFIEADDPEAIRNCILTVVRERIPARFGFDPFRDIQVLTPMNRTELGTRELNQRMQELLNPASGQPEIERLGAKFRVGDKVMQTVNNYDNDVFNGDIGRVVAIDAEEEELEVDFDGRRIKYEVQSLEELVLAYALTIHKSQGSEYAAVVIPLHVQHYIMLQRNLLYTGLTRGKKLVVLVGQRRALAAAVRRQDTALRYSALASRLRESSKNG